MGSIRKIIREEIEKLILESNFQNNYGLPFNFNLLSHAEKLEKDKVRAETAITQIESVMMQDFNFNTEKLSRIQEILRDW